MFVVCCKSILAILLQRKHQTIINASHVFVVFCKSIFAILLQRKRLIARMHHTCLLCFVNPSLQYCHKENIIHLACWLCFVNPSLQYCYKENIRRSSLHLACLLCFVNPSLQYDAPQTKIFDGRTIFWRVFSKHFSTSSSPNPVLTPLKIASKRHDRSFVLSSKIFDWGA